MARMTGSRNIGRVVQVGCVFGLLMAAGGVGGISGCGGGGWGKRKSETNKPSQEIDASLTGLSGNSEPVAAVVDTNHEVGSVSTQDQVLESARMMDEYFAAIDASARPEATEPIVQEHVQPDVQPSGAEDGLGDAGIGPAQTPLVVDASESDTPGSSQVDQESSEHNGGFSLASAAAELANANDETEQVVEEQAVDPEERKAELVSELVELLTDLARTSENPGAAAATLAGLDSLSPLTLDGLYEEGVLSEAELSTLKAARQVLASISSSGSIVSPEKVAEVLERVKNELDRQSGIRVVKSILCTQVDGYGKYEPFSSNDFLAGQSHEIIVYVEVDRFGWRELTGNDGQPRYEVEMSQRLELYHVADDMNTWNRAAEIDRSMSRNRVRDYYLINKVTLPANLGAGKYHLKVVMRDLIENKVSESIITIRMLAR